MNIKLIAMDLDGTTLLDDHRSFSPVLVSALESARSKGVMIVPATGRQFGMLPPMLKEHPVWETYAILCNGGQIRNIQTGEILHSLALSGDTLKALLSLSREFDLPVEFSANSRLHLTRESAEAQRLDPTIAFHVNTILPQYGIIEESLDHMCTDKDLPVEKVNIQCVPTQLRTTLEQRLQAINVSAVWSSKNTLEITHIDATKGNALKKLCRILDIPTDSVMAMGDSGNDISMLQLAGLGVAMENAPDFVKAKADVVTQRNTEDGAAHAIERYVLSNNL